MVSIDIESMARDNAIPRSGNMILLGAAQSTIGIEYGKLEEAIRRVFARKGEKVVADNLKALKLGKENGADTD